MRTFAAASVGIVAMLVCVAGETRAQTVHCGRLRRVVRRELRSAADATVYRQSRATTWPYCQRGQLVRGAIFCRSTAGIIGTFLTSEKTKTRRTRLLEKPTVVKIETLRRLCDLSSFNVAVSIQF
jgi:hypothetical protein